MGAADGTANNALAKKLGTSRPTVVLWRKRVQEGGVDTLRCDAPRPGRKWKPSCMRLYTQPRAGHAYAMDCGRTNRLCFGDTSHTPGLQPHRTETFKLSRNPDFVSKVRDIVGLYLNPPDKAVVLCVDEKSQIQANLIERSRYSRCVPASLLGKRMTMFGTVQRACLPRSIC